MTLDRGAGPAKHHTSGTWVLTEVALAAITFGDRLRQCRPEKIEELKQRLSAVGLITPVFVQTTGEGFKLIAGAYRVEAMRQLGRTHIRAFIVPLDATAADCKLWQIVENFDRVELTVQERADYLAAYTRHMDEKLAQSGPVTHLGKRSGGRGRVGGIRAAERALGISHGEANRLHRISKLSNCARRTSRELDLVDHQSALLAAAAHEEPQAQVDALHHHASRAQAQRTRPAPSSDPGASESNSVVASPGHVAATEGRRRQQVDKTTNQLALALGASVHQDQEMPPTDDKVESASLSMARSLFKRFIGAEKIAFLRHRDEVDLNDVARYLTELEAGKQVKRRHWTR